MNLYSFILLCLAFLHRLHRFGFISWLSSTVYCFLMLLFISGMLFDLALDFKCYYYYRVFMFCVSLSLFNNTRPCMGSFSSGCIKFELLL